MAFTPLAPNAGPIGGDGVAFPAGIVSFYIIPLSSYYVILVWSGYTTS
jgi:hypothetical protein